MTELRLEGVRYEYDDGTVALDGVDLIVPGGSDLALVGANGSGKSTLLRHLDGLLRPTAGRVLVDGRDAAEMRVAELARVVGLAFQDPDRQIFDTNVRSEVEFGPRRMGLDDTEAFPIATAALEQVGLENVLGTHPGDLGDTDRKLLSIASVLAMHTPVVALDEPTTGLDTAGVARVAGVTEALRGEGRTVIAVSHEIRFMVETFGRIVVLDRGRVVLDGSPAVVFEEANWPVLLKAGLEPPYSARVGAHLGLGSTPTDAALIEALLAAAG